MELTEHPRPAPVKLTERINILLVDDESRNLDVLESILASPELRFVRASNPNDALLALINNEFACIVLDIQMPGMSGLELARLIKSRKRTQSIPIIFLTAYFLDEKDILEGYDVGAVDYLTKPVNLKIFKSKVSVFVDLFRTTRALAAANESLEHEIYQRKTAEEALRTVNLELEAHVRARTSELSLSEKRYREVVGSLPVAVYTTDAEGKMDLFNEAAVDLWGRQPEIGSCLWCGSYKIFRPDGTPLPVDQCPMAVTLRTGTAVRGQEVIIERPDGTRRNVLPYPQPIRDPAGKIIGAVNMLVDITERKRSEDENRRLAAIVGSSADAIIGKNLHGVITSWNDGARWLFGYTAEEAIGRPVSMLIPPDRINEETGILEAISRGESIGYETVRQRKNGGLVEISLSVSPIKNVEGKVVGASKIARDITDRKRNEKNQHVLYELSTTVNRSSCLNEVFEAAIQAMLQCQNAARAAILLYDDRAVMRFNTWHNLSDTYRQAVEGHCPWSPDEEDHKPVFINDCTTAALDAALASAIKKEGIQSVAFIPIVYGKKLLGKFMVYYDQPHDFTLEETRPAQTIASQIAVSIERQRVLQELKKAHDELVAALRTKDDFLAALSHELRTPLNPILLIASDAVNNSALPPQLLSDFDTIRKNVELEARLIDDLLDLTRIARGKLLLEKQVIPLHEMLSDALDQIRDELKQKRINLQVDLKADHQKVEADPVRIQQIFWNILKNAVKFTPENGRIVVTSQVVNDKIQVAINDTGIGISADELPNIFTAFSQGDHTRGNNRNQFGGLGLGLAISQKLAEHHLGTISAASQGKDQGAIFTVELPLAQTAGASQPPVAALFDQKADAPVLNHNTQILLVEDHEPTRNSLARLLKNRKYQVVTASSVSEAKNLAAAQPFDLLISDIGLPDGSGYDLIIELKKKQAIEGIALTGFGTEQDIQRSQEAGFITHLIKPIRIQSLELALNKVASLIQK